MQVLEVCVGILLVGAALCAVGAMAFYTWFLCAKYFTDYLEILAHKESERILFEERLKRSKQ